jgi:DNA-binding response OmpR family regulator
MESVTRPQQDRATGAAPALTAGNLRVDVEQYRAFVSEATVTLTYQEFELLRILVRGRDRILAFDDLIAQLWPGNPSGMRRSLGVVICRLRAKLSASWPYRIHTVRNRGYGLIVPPGATRA